MSYEDGHIGCEETSSGDHPDIRSININLAVPRDEWLYTLFSGKFHLPLKVLFVSVPL